MSDISLSEALRQLRAELTKAQNDADPNGLRFDMREIELELQIAASKETELKGQAEGSGSIWSVVTAKVGGSAARTSGEDLTHRIKLTMGLSPDKDGNPQKIAGRDAPPAQSGGS